MLLIPGFLWTHPIALTSWLGPGCCSVPSRAQVSSGSSCCDLRPCLQRLYLSCSINPSSVSAFQGPLTLLSLTSIFFYLQKYLMDSPCHCLLKFKYSSRTRYPCIRIWENHWSGLGSCLWNLKSDIGGGDTQGPFRSADSSTDIPHTPYHTLLNILLGHFLLALRSPYLQLWDQIPFGRHWMFVFNSLSPFMSKAGSEFVKFWALCLVHREMLVVACYSISPNLVSCSLVPGPE